MRANRSKKSSSLTGLIIVAAIGGLFFIGHSVMQDKTPSASSVRNDSFVTSDPTNSPAPTDSATVPAAESTGVPVASTAYHIGDYKEDGSYARSDYGQAWKDVDHNGCDTRDDVLTRDVRQAVISSDCKVESGVATDPYTGTTINFVRGVKTSTELPVDHVFSLGDAFYAGARNWSQSKREAFANDPAELTVTSQAFNSWKSDKSPSEMAATEYQLKDKGIAFTGKCFYATKYTNITVKYDLPVRQIDADVLKKWLATCK